VVPIPLKGLSICLNVTIITGVVALVMVMQFSVNWRFWLIDLDWVAQALWLTEHNLLML